MGLWLENPASGRVHGVISTDLSDEMNRVQKIVGAQSDGTTLDLGRARAWMENLGRVNSERNQWSDVRSVDERMDLPTGSVPVRVYNPATNDLTIVFIHGGGWVFGSLDSHDTIPRWLAAETGARVVSVGYSLAPEHPFPRAIEECAGVISTLLAGAKASHRLFVCGDSAGANIGAMAILRLTSSERAAVTGFVSVYGVYSPEMNLSSHKLYGDGRFGLSEQQMRWFWNLYAPHLAASERDQLTPLGADLTGFPTTLCIGTECDLLLDDTLALYSRLAGVQVDVSLSLWPTLSHGCLVFVGAVESVTQAAGSITHFIDVHRGASEARPRPILTALKSEPLYREPQAQRFEASGLRGPLLDVGALFLTSRSRLHGSVSHTIASDIVAGRLSPGELLPTEDKGSTSFGVSRSAYREAIRTLAAKGLVNAQPKVGTRVTPRSDWQLLDPDVLAWHFEAGPSDGLVKSFFELRTTVESNAAALTAGRRDDEDISKLADALARIARSSPYSGGWLNAVIAYHKAILFSTKNEAFTAIWPVINATVRWSVKLQMMLPTLELVRDPVADYAAVFEKITSQNAKAAHQAMAELVDRSLVDTLANFKRVQQADAKQRDSAQAGIEDA
jgi:acetyl esterase/lipase/DNA-binding FadR family transcriptional regulator